MSTLSEIVAGPEGILSLLDDAKTYYNKGYIANYRMQMEYVDGLVKKLNIPAEKLYVESEVLKFRKYIENINRVV